MLLRQVEWAARSFEMTAEMTANATRAVGGGGGGSEGAPQIQMMMMMAAAVWLMPV